MANNCALIPKVRNKNGQIVDSKLFKDLLSFTSNNRSEAVKLYQITKSKKFIETWNPRLVLDDNEEPTFSSLLEKTNIGEAITEEKILRQLNKQIGYYKKNSDRPALWPITNSNSRKLREKAIAFNTTSEFRNRYIASVIKIMDNETNRIAIGVRIERKNQLNSLNADKMEYNAKLNEKLRSILESKGVTVGALTSLEERLGISGVTDFDISKKTAEGLIEMIRLAEGVRGEKALPEEFAHFAIEALGDNAFVNRLINNLYSNNLAKEILGEEFEDYNKKYGGDELLLTKEAAGKLLAKHLLKNESIPNKPYKNILIKVIQAVKDFFKNISASPIQKAIIDADKKFGYLAQQILNGEIVDDMNVSNITSNKKLYQLQSRIDLDTELVKKIIKNESKRLHIYEKRSSNVEFSDKQRAFIDTLEKSIIDHNEIEGIYTFLSTAIGDLTSLKKRLNILYNTEAANLNEKAKVLRDVRNYIYSYSHIIDDINKALIAEERYENNRYGERIRVALDNTLSLINNLHVEYMDVTMPLFVNYIKPFVGDGIDIPFGKWKGVKLTAEDIIAGVKKDEQGNVLWYQEEISFFDRYLDSMADSSDYMLKIIDQAVKKSKENARLDTIEIQKEIEKATLELERAGVKDILWMFERDSKGNLTGRYIQEINYGLYHEKKREMEEGLIKKYGENPVGEDAKKYARERRQWYENNLDPAVDGIRRPKKSIYENKEFKNLSGAKKDYYYKILGIKEKLDSYLPENYTRLYNTIKIRKDLLERVKNSNNVKAGTTQIWEAVKDQFVRRSDDTEFGDRATIKDFENREVQILPIYYTKLREGESNNDISTDIASTLTAYASMANDFKEMNKVIDVLELGRDLLRERQIQQERGGKPLLEKFQVMGRKFEDALTKSGDKTRFIERLNDFFEMRVYGRYMADEGTFGKTNIDKAKVANFVNNMTSLNTLALNVLSGVSNLNTGTVMMRIESFSKEFFTESNTLTADRNYAFAMKDFLAEVGNRVRVSKLALWDELFDVLQEYDTDIKNTNFDRKTWFSRSFQTSALYFMNNSGEHWMQNRTSLALADAYKMKDDRGNIVSLWDAMEVVYLDPNNKKLGAKLQVKKGYTKEDGSEFTRNDIIAFSRKSAAINQRMHGIYNKADMNAIQRLSIGRMAMMFRKWIKPSLNRRWKSAQYNFDIQDWTEGYYRTTGRFLWQVAKELREGQFALVANFKKLSKTEKANIRRAATEVGHLIAIALLLGFIEWPDDEDRPWVARLAEYQLRRLYTEIGAQTPGTQMGEEMLRIIKSPAAGVNTLERLIDMVGLCNPYNYESFAGEEALIQSGRYKGESRATRLFYESPLLPMNKTIYRGLHPEEGIPFFKQ